MEEGKIHASVDLGYASKRRGHASDPATVLCVCVCVWGGSSYSMILPHFLNMQMR